MLSRLLPVSSLFAPLSTVWCPDAFSQELYKRVANLLLTPRVMKLSAQRFGQSQPMIRFPQSNHASIRRQTLIQFHNLDRTIEFRLK